MYIMTPREIYEELNKKVIGQDHAKKVIANEVFKHFLRLQHRQQLIEKDKYIGKSNIMMTGLTGTGKTYLAQTLAEILDVPFAITDATTLTEAGYVGEDVENILLKLIQNANYDIEKAEKGVVFIDEIDKIGRKSENPSITRDVSGEGVQQALLKILEGTIASVPPQGGRKHPQQTMIEIDTKDILFIAGGSFEGIEDIVRKRINVNKGSIGFISSDKTKTNELSIREIRGQIDANDLKRFGMIPELLGRFPIVTNLEPLEVEDLVNILKLSTGIIQEYVNIFELQEKKLKFDDDALIEVANIAIKENLGARGLRAIIEKVMMEIMFEAPSQSKRKYIIGKNEILNIYVNNKYERIA